MAKIIKTASKGPVNCSRILPEQLDLALLEPDDVPVEVIWTLGAEVEILRGHRHGHQDQEDELVGHVLAVGVVVASR